MRRGLLFLVIVGLIAWGTSYLPTPPPVKNAAAPVKEAKPVKGKAIGETSTGVDHETDADKAALVKIMKDAVAARHHGVLPKSMSKEDMEIAAQAAMKWKRTQQAAKLKHEMDAMKVKPPPSSGYAEIEVAKVAITKMMREPSSAVFDDVFFVNDRKSEAGYYVPVVCGTVNGRNGFGGMTGPKHFVAVMSDAVQGLWLEGTTPQNTLASEWNRFCAGRHE